MGELDSIDRQLSRKEATFYMAQARSATTARQLANVIWQASGLLEVRDDGIKVAGWLKSRHHPILLRESYLKEVRDCMDHLNEEALQQLRDEFNEFVRMHKGGTNE